MTDKKEKILNAALELFSSDGYNGTSTGKIARKAGVSEGLIFRHFTNKEGLLKAVVDLGEERVKQLYNPLLNLNEPKKIIKKAIDIPFEVPVEEYQFWKLQYKIKWEIEDYNDEKLDPVRAALRNAFEKLEYQFPEMESEALIILTEGIGGSILKGSALNRKNVKEYLYNKYEI
ncbi:TetR/AcrR family transcriptional regulator [Mangrovivirga cuniculi]|uniref:HTH tetR-type domain-containing protein n=1 Tax=Mangrovivirga cuniculi TaxID=2715131 RepID=A0A4D7JVU8_9BACT|nr:helix-turn-helix domain-containing protein [Mangrovivirga cuniculi]QCK16652.1 hypothetical protein DCC35_18905 [Mangrovivirga cuniculi]